MDRISQLPECIVHHILSCFQTDHILFTPPVELVRMSVLSKKWFNLTASFPILKFNIRNFNKVSRQSFFKYVEYTTSRFCHQNITHADTFRIFTSFKEPAEVDIVNRVLELIFQKGVQVFEICSTGFSNVRNYRLSNKLLSVSVLKSLTISDFELPSSLMVDVIQLKSLTHLTLEDVNIDDEAIKHLTTSCPFLQEFHISCCRGFEIFCVCGHQHLQKVFISYDTYLKEIDIEAPNLSELELIDKEQLGQPQMNLASCKKLTTVTYNGQLLTYSNYDFLSNFPFIETLSLVTMYEGDKLKLSSHSLRTLVLESNFDLENIELSTRNLVFFIYSCNDAISSLEVMDKCQELLKNSTYLKACMHCYPDGSIDDIWFRNLRLFLDKNNEFKVFNLYITPVFTEKFIDLEKLKETELLPYELEHVELQLDTYEESLNLVAFVDAVLWCCCPQTLTLRRSLPSTDSELQSDVVKFTYDKLLEQVDQRCTRIQMVSPSSFEAQKQLRNLKSLSMALPCEGKAITFIKEQV